MKSPRFAAVSDPALIDINSKDVFGKHGTFRKYFVFHGNVNGTSLIFHLIIALVI